MRLGLSEKREKGGGEMRRWRRGRRMKKEVRRKNKEVAHDLEELQVARDVIVEE